MSERMTREELAAKVEWEGGVTEAITGYGLGPDVLPESAPRDVRGAWERIYASAYDADVIWEWLYGDAGE